MRMRALRPQSWVRTFSTTRPPLLFTPGPLTTSDTVRAPMTKDYGSRDTRFIECIKDVRIGLTEFCQDKEGNSLAADFSTVLLPGSGTNSVESVIQSTVPRGGRLLVLVNGVYGQRIQKIADTADIACDALEFDWTQPMDVAKVKAALSETHYDLVAVIHHETTTGMVNPISAIGEAVRSSDNCNPNSKFFVDAMSSFGGMECDMTDVDVLVSSSNKCIQGVPGFGFILARAALLPTLEGNSRSHALDLYEQWKGLENTGQFRFTPPCQAIVAFGEALKELQVEGLQGRINRYKANQVAFLDGADKLGLEPLLEADLMGPIISSYLFPEDPEFNFKTLYDRLSDKGFIIYPGTTYETKDRATLRIGHIGAITPAHTTELVEAFGEVYEEMGVKLQ